MRSPFLLALVLLALLSGADARAVAPPVIEPRYSGRTMRAWIDDLADEDLLVREEAIEVLAQLGPTAKVAAPALEKLLAGENRTLRTRAALALWRIARQAGPAVKALAENMRTATPIARRDALLTLAEIGTDAAPATPAILELFDDPDDNARTQAINTLTRLGKVAQPHLVKALESKEVRTRRNALQVFLNGPSLLSKDIIPALSARLADDDLAVRTRAARILWGLEQSTKPVADVLLAGVRSTNATVRGEVISTLTFSTHRSSLAIPIYEHALHDKDMALRINAARGLFDVENKADRVLPVYLEALKDTNRNHWHNAITGISAVGPNGGKALPRLIEVLKVRDYYVPYEIRNALVRIGPDAIPPLVKALKEPEPPANPFGGRLDYGNSMHETTIYVLGQFGARGAAAVVPLLADKDTSVRIRACRVLGAVGSPARDAVPKLTALLEDGNVNLRQAVVTALGNIGADAKSSAPKLLELVAKDSSSVRIAALRALLNIGPEPRPTVAVCVKALEDTDPALRLAAVELLWNVDRKHKAIAGQLTNLLGTTTLRGQVLGLVTRMGADAEKAVPAVIESMRDPNEYTRRQAAEALGAIGPGAKDATTDLFILLRERNVYTQSAVLQALKKVGTEPKVLIPKLTEFVKEHARTGYVHSAIVTLSEYGPAASSSAPVLLAVLDDPLANSTHLPAREALARIAPAEARKKAAPFVRRLLAGNETLPAARALLLIDPKDKDGIKVVRDAFQSTYEYTRGTAATTAGALGANGKVFADDLKKLLKDSKPGARGPAALALWRITRDADTTVPVLQALLGDPFSYHRSGAVQLLAEMGPAAKPAIPALRKLASSDGDASVRTSAVTALKKIDVAPPKGKKAP